jgi:hypothetical protein
MAVHLNKKTHTYTVNGVVKPAVSDIMRVLSEHHYHAADKYGHMEKARERGERVHEAVDFYINFGIFDKDYSDYVNAFAQWMLDYKVKIINNEQILTDGDYCGTTDLYVEIDGRKILVDMKATAAIHENLLEVQLAGYYLLYQRNGKQVDATYVLHLKPNKYVYKPIAINLAKWKELYAKFTHESDRDKTRGQGESL